MMPRSLLRVAASCLALAASLALPATARAGDWVDTRLNFTVTDENLLVRPGETNPSVPGVRIGMPNRLGILFFDNYDTRYSGYENLSNLAIYAHKSWRLTEVEGAFVLRVMELSDLANQIIDNGSYIKLTRNITPNRDRPTYLALTLFPMSGDRMRLGYSYRISWGGSPVFFKPNPDNPTGSTGSNSNPVPAAKLQIGTERYYAYVGAKTSVFLNPKTNEQEAHASGLLGVGVDPFKALRLELNGGYFDRGGNPKEEVLGASVRLMGASIRATYHVGMPVGTSADYLLYKNDPASVGFWFQKESYPGGLSYLVSASFNLLAQSLQDPDHAASTKYQLAHAADLLARLKWNFTRLHASVMFRTLSYILNNVPSFVPFQDFPAAASVKPEIFAALGASQYFPRRRITLGLTAGIQLPATFTAPQLPPELVGNNPVQLGQSSTMVVRQEGDVSLLPAGEKAMPIYAVKLLARQDFLEYFAAIIDLYYTLDQNQSKLCRSFDGATCAPADATGRESEFIRTFIKPHALGFNVTLQAKF
ncbi:MAG: hypothetical protein HY906_16070 [Deltaproteobacteria bacterium]|nr:hypothetical protein [Deltaproteobacteria bacterium]